MQKTKLTIFLLTIALFFSAILYSFENKKLGLSIVNPETHPHEGKNWTVFFYTTGTADLNVYPLNKSTVDDLDFVYLICKDKKLSPKFDNKSILHFDNWQCDGLAALVYKVKQSGNHNFKFKFGNKIGLANNSSNVTYDYSASSSVSRMAYEGKDNATSVPVNIASSSWTVVGTQFTTGMYTNINSSNDAYASTTDTSSSSFKQIVHEFYIKINEATSTVSQINYYWEGRSAKSEEVESDNDLRLYIYDYTNSSWRLTSTSLDNACNSSDCALSHNTSTNISNFFDRNKGVRFMVQKYEAGHNCSSSPTTITCGKNVTSTTYNTGCTYQASTQDLWNQCATSSNSCLTGNCDGTIFSCGSYNDWQQHSCNTCYGCAGGPDCIPQSTLPGYGSTYGCTGTTDAECATCTAGTCETTSCEGLQCNCQAGYCVSGVCVRNCLSLCQSQGFANGSCYPDEMSCWMAGGFPNGDVDCTMPDRLCCCFY